ncbi:N-formylglutamate deformylase [Herbaspirillum sp. RV1423]|uniref:N-formylglutamate deformylase n=1 Tax=Herbaspirillum sp. RV1423 TaxID=1443993 RepID=UPI0004B6D8B9|nr:N-formylglutamate deformylase [Herbaspirillum sp. RV1423]
MAVDVFNLKRGEQPLLISIPHMGTRIPAEIADRLTPAASLLADTDWHLAQLYDFGASMGATILHANYSRYVIDLNRPPGGESLYPGQTTTSLCPTETFPGEPIYQEGQAPAKEEIAARLATYWRPYHDQLQAELARLRALHGAVLLWEAHSIASRLPRLFDGKLPDFNLGTNEGRSCSVAVQEAIERTAPAACGKRYTSVVNGRFKGGYITRHYGQPQDNVHAVQLEMCQSTYMDETPPFGYRPDLAQEAAPVIRTIMDAALQAVQRR